MAADPPSDATATGPLWVSELEVRRIAGVTPDTGFRLRDLPRGLVLIHGPNGCGKSTTAAAVRALVWPGPSNPAPLDLRAAVRRGGESWELEALGDRVRALRQGKPVPLPAGVAPETRSRYHWSLRTLLLEQDRDLAAALATEMAGGVDFHLLAGELGWDRLPAGPQKLAREVDARERDVRDAVRRQEALRREAETLESLGAEREEAARVRDRKPHVAAAGELRAKEEALRRIRETLAEFPPDMDRVQADDALRLQSARDKQARAGEDLEALRRELASLSGNEEAWQTLGDEELKQTIREAEAFREHWREAARNADQAREEVDRAEVAETELRRHLGIQNPEGDALQGYRLPELRSWMEQVLRIMTLEEDIRALEPARGTSLDTTPATEERLRDLRRELQRLHADMSPATLFGPPSLWLATAALIGMLAWTAHTLQAHPGWVALALLPLATHPLLRYLGVRATWKRLRDAFPDPAEDQGEDQEEIPETPGDQAVRSLMRDVDVLLTELPRRRRREERIREVEEAREELGALAEELDGLGLQARADRIWIRNFLEDLQTWRRERSRTAQAEEVLSTRQQRLDRLREPLAELCARWGTPAPQTDPLPAAEGLRERLRAELERRGRIRELQSREEHLRERVREAERERRTLLNRLNLPAERAAEVAERVERLSEWNHAFRKSEILVNRVSELRTTLREEDPKLMDLSAGELKAMEADCDRAAAREAEVRDIRSRLEQRIQDQSRGRQVHTALERLESARRELEQERARHAEARTGRAILDWLRDECRAHRSPQTLEDANHLLARFTRGNLQLELDWSEDGQTFRASRPGQPLRPLDTLSSGERTQVLMAVRLAFLQRRESVPLPLLVDEALGTSDDERSRAVMSALVDIAAQGRQIFVFTAQTDEVAKWRSVLDTRPKLEARVIDLQAVREGDLAARTPIRAAAAPRPPQPGRREGETDRQWAERLRIPDWRPSQPVDAIPLWHLLRRAEEALTALLTHRIDTRGAYRALAEAGVAESIIAPETARKLEARAAALEALAEAWRTGRPLPVDPGALLDSGIVSETFQDEVLALLKSVDHDAARLLDALENKAVPRWRQDNTDQLRALFRETGGLPDRDPLSPEERRARAIADLQGTPHLDRLSSADWSDLEALFPEEP